MSNETMTQASTMANMSTKTGFANGADEILQAVVNAADGDHLLEINMLAESKGRLKQAGRTELAEAGFGDLITTISELREGTIDHATARQRIHRAALEGASAGSMATSSIQTVRMIAPEIDSVLREQVAGTIVNGQHVASDSRDIVQQYAALSNEYNRAYQLAPQNARVMADEIFSQSVDITTLPQDLRDMVTTQADGTRSTRTEMTHREIMEALGHHPEAANMMARGGYRNPADLTGDPPEEPPR
jgi:hypothetical protein